MSIETELIAAKHYLDECYDVVEMLDGTIPQVKSLSNLSTAVNSIQSNVTPETGIASYTISAGGGVIPIGNTAGYTVPDNFFTNITRIEDNALSYLAYTDGSNSDHRNANVFNKIDFSNVTYIGEYGCFFAFLKCSRITNISFNTSSSISIGLNGCTYMFSGCDQITTADLRGIHTLIDNAADAMFLRCSSLTSVDLSNLTSVGDVQAVFQSTGLTSMSFPSLTTTTSNLALKGWFTGCSHLTSIHFRTDAQSTIEALSDYTNKFGADNATIYFDL